MYQAKILAGSLLTIALLVPTLASAQTYSQSQAYGTPSSAPAAPSAPMSSSSTSSSYSSATYMLAPIKDRILSDPLYLPLTGQIEGISAYTLSLPSSSAYRSATGVKISNNNSANNNLAQSVEYGVTDDFSIRAAENYAWGHGYNDNQLTGNDTSTTTYGWSDPSFGASYRFIDQRKNFPVDATITLDYTPNMIDAQVANAGGESGNNAVGRQVATITADVGREMKMFSIDAFTGTTYDGKRESYSAATGYTTDTDPLWSYFMGLRSQIRFTDRASMNAGYRFSATGDSTATVQQTGGTTYGSTPDQSDFNLAFNFHFIPNRLVGQLSYDYIMSNESTAYNPASARNATTIDDSMSSVIGARLFYTFN